MEAACEPHPCRAETLDRLAAERLDVLVVGGGILGAGVARDAALRGLRVGLVEQHDLAFGTSSRSSRLLHGGLRYLAQGRLGLVREASREKVVLARIAPHLAEPLPFTFPTYRGTRWPLWQLRIGVKLYDLLCGQRNLGNSGWMNEDELCRHVPGIATRQLTGGVRYFDALTNDARLVIDTHRAAARSGAMIGNYLRLEQAEPAVHGWNCDVHDVLADRGFRLTARTVINATGPWADQFPYSQVRLRRTKGVHLVVDRQRLPVPDAVAMTEGSRILFAIPWGERVILGTTDTDFDGPLESVRTEPSDVNYILQIVNACFPQARLNRSDVVSAWAGLRPLIAATRGGPSDISRAHQIRMGPPGWLDVAGGKLTTYRLIGEQTVDRVLRHLGVRALPCRTADEPLLPPSEVESRSGILPPPVSRELVDYFCRHEWAVHLADVMLRRTGWYYYRQDAAEVTRQVAGWMAEIRGWDPARQAQETRLDA